MKTIDEETVEKFEEKWQEIDVFKLTNAIAGRQTGEALKLLSQIGTDTPAEVISLVGLLHWQVKRLWQARLLTDRGDSPSTVMQKCRISPKASVGMRIFQSVPFT